MEHDERRRRRRFSVSWPIRVLDNERELARGETANISRSGAYFRSAVPASLEPGMTVSVCIGAAGADESVSGGARVVRLDTTAEQGCGVALHFSRELDPFTAPEPE